MILQDVRVDEGSKGEVFSDGRDRKSYRTMSFSTSFMLDEHDAEMVFFTSSMSKNTCAEHS